MTAEAECGSSIVDWEDYAAFEEFPKTSAFQEFLELLPQIAAGPPTIRNARFRNGSGFSSLATSPVLEMTTTYLPLGVDAPAYEKIVDSFLPILAKNTKGLIGSASGWIIEEQESPVAGSADTKVKAFVVCLAWESIDAHVSSTRIPENKEAIAPWKAAILHAEMVCHISHHLIGHLLIQ